jgi:hypothetical protein
MAREKVRKTREARAFSPRAFRAEEWPLSCLGQEARHGDGLHHFPCKDPGGTTFRGSSLVNVHLTLGVGEGPYVGFIHESRRSGHAWPR